MTDKRPPITLSTGEKDLARDRLIQVESRMLFSILNPFTVVGHGMESVASIKEPSIGVCSVGT